MGFSTHTCLPAAAAAFTESIWFGVGVQISSISTSEYFKRLRQARKRLSPVPGGKLLSSLHYRITHRNKLGFRHPSIGLAMDFPNPAKANDSNFLHQHPQVRN